MSQEATENLLSSRDREILRDVIGTYILTGEPVSSRLLSRMDRHSLSAASIRNVMADLEDLGYLTHPHTSAGRVPTDEGYHLYVHSLMPNRKVPARARRYIRAGLAESEGDADALISTAGQLLSELSEKVGIVITPAIGETTVKDIHFVPMTGSKVLCLVVSASGFVDNKVIETREPVGRDELVRISNYLNEHFAGLTLREVRRRLLEMMARERAQVDRLLASAIELAESAFAGRDDRDLLVEGTSSLLRLPELADVNRVRRLLDTFADKASLVGMLSQLIEGRGVRVVIGGDSDLTSDLDFSLVATTYGASGEGSRGRLAVFGPSRMDYEKLVPLVEYFGNRLSLALESVYSEDETRSEETPADREAWK